MRKLSTGSLLVCLVLSVTAASGVGCSAAARVTPLKRTFLEDVNIDAKKKNLPFDHSLVVRGAKKSAYKNVFVKPVRTDLLDKSDWTSSASALITSEADYMEKAAEVAQYLREQIILELRNSEVKRLRVVSSPGPETMIFEIVLTELEFSHPLAKAGALAVPVPGTGAALAAVSDPHAAFAARVTDAETGKLLATVADRKFAPTRIFDLNKLTVSSSVREVCALWAKSIAEAAQGDGFSQVEEKRWSIVPW